MAINDPIADFLTRIRNASLARHRFVDCRWSKIKQNIAEILKLSGFIETYLVKNEEEGRGTLRVFLKYKERRPQIQGLKRVSRPGCRQYINHNEIPRFYGGFGLAILSTSQGLKSGAEAHKLQIGGELLCMVW